MSRFEPFGCSCNVCLTVLQEADLIQQKAALESRIRKLNEEAEASRLHADRMNKRIEFLEQRAAESSSSTSRQISELTDEVQQLQEALLAEQTQCRQYKRDSEDARRALDQAEQSKLVRTIAQSQLCFAL